MYSDIPACIPVFTRAHTCSVTPPRLGAEWDRDYKPVFQESLESPQTEIPTLFLSYVEFLNKNFLKTIPALSKFESYSSVLKMVLSCDLLPLGVPGDLRCHCHTGFVLLFHFLGLFLRACTGEGCAGAGTPTGPPPHHPPSLALSSPIPHPPLSLHHPHSHPTPSLCPRWSQWGHPPCGLCVSGQLLKVTFVSVVLCALSWLLGGPCRSPLSPSSPHFPRTPTPCLGGSSGAGCPLPLGCEQWSEQPFILPAGVKCILC